MRTFVVLLAVHVIVVFASVEETDKDCGADETCLKYEDCPSFQKNYARFKSLTKSLEKSNLKTELKEAVCNKNEKAVCCPQQLKFGSCGLVATPPGKVTGGDDTKPGEFPWAALVGHEIILEDNDHETRQLVNRTCTRYHCGGTLINTWFVLTAAHCQTDDTKIVEVVLGEWNVLERNPLVQKQAVADVVVHIGYDSSQLINDIAIVKMKTEVKLNALVQLACLPLAEYNLPSYFHNLEHKIATVIGWGESSWTNMNYNQSYINTLIKHQHGVLTPIIQKGLLTIQPLSLCQEAYPRYQKTISHSNLCAGGDQWHTDSCQGDSGGGLFVNYASQRGNAAVLVGVSSYGASRLCGDSPSVYTRVDQFIPWIRKTILG